MDIQTTKEHYNFNSYVHVQRWCSYYYQIKEVLKFRPATVLVIGIGDGIVIDLLRKQNVIVYTLDFDSSLDPDFCGSVSDLGSVLGDLNVDVILCCQVLEHLPYTYFTPILMNMRKFAKQVILSLPKACFQILKLSIKMQNVRTRTINLYIPMSWKTFKGDKDPSGHYWEIGCRNHSFNKIKKDILKIFKISSSFSPVENSYHHFFVLI